MNEMIHKVNQADLKSKSFISRSKAIKITLGAVTSGLKSLFTKNIE